MRILLFLLMLSSIACVQVKDKVSNCHIDKNVMTCPDGSSMIVNDGKDAVNVGVATRPTTNECSNGGIVLTTFKDFNNNGLQDDGDIVVSSSVVCNGVDGLTVVGPKGDKGDQGIPGESIVGPKGEIGNTGAVGPQGPQGNPGESVTGPAGKNGADGTPGTIIVPIKFCPNDNSAFPEYGLLVGSQLFAVYWGTTPASPSNNQAFLALIPPGMYRSTGGNNCTFTLNADYTVN